MGACRRRKLLLTAALAFVLGAQRAAARTRQASAASAAPGGATAPRHIPPRRSSQIHDGFGINSDLPRDPYLPWDRWWWTRMFDAGVKWIRLGQYENSSDQTSWDWVERRRGTLQIAPELDDYVDSLVDNGVHIQVQLLYGNPMYTSPAGRLPGSILPAPGSFHNADRSLYSIFWPPRTPGQIEAFLRYVRFMVSHFRGRIRYWALWNEQDIDYWNPQANPEQYGRLLRAFAGAVHETDPEARVIYGGQAWPLSRDFARRALDACQCAPAIDVFAYHIYPDYGRNLNPEAVDQGAWAAGGGRLFREMIRHYPGVRPDIEFWCDEFNSIPSWEGMDDSVQVKYIPRGLVYNWAAGVRTFVWELTPGTDGNEYDDFGMIHGLRYLPDDFTPRPVFSALAYTNALFSDTRSDPSIRLESPELEAISHRAGAPLFVYGFRRSDSGQSIVAYWLGARSEAGRRLPDYQVSVRLENSGIRQPVLIDVASGRITPLRWRDTRTATLGPLPASDSVMAIADEAYFDWAILPEAPSSLTATAAPGGLELAWRLHGDNPTGVIVERRLDASAAENAAKTLAESAAGGRVGKWEEIVSLHDAATRYTDSSLPERAHASYRVRAVNAAGQSAYSNVVRAP